MLIILRHHRIWEKTYNNDTVKPFVGVVQHVPAEPQQKQAQSWYRHHTPAPAAVMLIQASSLLDAAPTATIILINLD